MIAQVKVVSSGKRLKVVLYLRMSSDEQDGSIERQRIECREYAARYNMDVVGEYIDDGKSGSKEIEKRVDFHRMIADAQKGTFNAILCWNMSRFGRLDSHKSAPFKVKLREAGVHLEVVCGSAPDWNTGTGRIIDTIETERQHEYSITLSKDSLSGRANRLADGWWPHGLHPYGYDKLYYEGSQVVKVVKRGEHFGKARDWKCKLQINEAEAEVVRWMFTEFAQRGTSLRRLGFELSKREVPTPDRGVGGWTKDTVKMILRKNVYCGDITIGYAQRQNRETHNRAEKKINKGGCPAIIDRATWEAVNAELDKRKAMKRKPHAKSQSALSGVLICGHCGYRMDRKSRITKAGATTTYFTCSSAMKRPDCGCKQWRVHESEILPVLCDELVKAVDWQLLKKIQAAPPARSQGELETQKNHAAELEKNIERATKNMLVCDPSIFPEMQAGLIGLKADLAKLRNTIKLATESAGDEANQFHKWWDETKAKVFVFGAKLPNKKPLSESALRQLTEIQKDGPMLCNGKPFVVGDTGALNAILHKLNCQLWLTWVPNGSRFHKLDTGVLKANFGEHTLGMVGSDTPQRVLVEVVIKFAEISGSIRFGKPPVPISEQAAEAKRQAKLEYHRQWDRNHRKERNARNAKWRKAHPGYQGRWLKAKAAKAKAAKQKAAKGV